MSPLKVALALVWILCLLAVVVPGDHTGLALGRRLFLFLVVVHAIECVAFLGRLRRAPGSLAMHLLQTFLFGIVHVRGLPAPGTDAQPAA